MQYFYHGPETPLPGRRPEPIQYLSRCLFKAGTVTVNFVDCETAEFRYSPDDDSLKDQIKIARIDSDIWKYCD